jgi:hypothetical protein
MLLIWAFYGGRWRRLRRARDAAIRSAEAEVATRMERYLLDQRLAILAALVQRLSPVREPAPSAAVWSGRLSRLEESCHAGRQAVEPGSAEAAGSTTIASRFSLELPETSFLDDSRRDDIETADRQARQELTRRLVEMALKVDPQVFTGWVTEAWAGAYEGIFASTLQDFLGNSPAARERAQAVLLSELTSTVGDRYEAGQHGRVVRYLCVPGGTKGALTQLLDHDSGILGGHPQLGYTTLTATHESNDSQFVAVVHAFDATAIAEGEAT